MAISTIIGAVALLAAAVILLSLGVLAGREKSALSRRHCSGHSAPAGRSRKP